MMSTDYFGTSRLADTLKHIISDAVFNNFIIKYKEVRRGSWRNQYVISKY